MKKLMSLIALLLALLVNPAQAENVLRLATTTSTDNTGLLKILHPPFEEKYGVRVDVIAVGTGKALRLGKNGDVDVVFVHAPAAEMKFVNEGSGTDRSPVMHNDFVIVGPKDDPANLGAANNLTSAMRTLAQSGSSFISRGDDSGTHKKELSLWKTAGIAAEGSWYLSAGQGMGAVLQIANDKLAYALTDRGTYIAMREKLDIGVVYEGAPELFNPYHVIAVNPKKHQHANYDMAKKYIDYLQSEQGQQVIRDFRMRGEPLFIPDVIK